MNPDDVNANRMDEYTQDLDEWREWYDSTIGDGEEEEPDDGVQVVDCDPADLVNMADLLIKYEFGQRKGQQALIDMLADDIEVMLDEKGAQGTHGLVLPDGRRIVVEAALVSHYRFTLIVANSNRDGVITHTWDGETSW